MIKKTTKATTKAMRRCAIFNIALGIILIGIATVVFIFEGLYKKLNVHSSQILVPSIVMAGGAVIIIITLLCELSPTVIRYESDPRI
jgi:uncharacterized SAM-binding protein YcdF (DUF218 family)